MKIPRQTKNAYDPDFASFKFLVRLCARSKTLMKRLVHAADFGSTVSTWCVNDARLKLPGAFMMLDLNYLVRL